jgi:DNA/RNA endonuclease YhcR with UshA esterase domain
LTGFLDASIKVAVKISHANLSRRAFVNAEKRLAIVWSFVVLTSFAVNAQSKELTAVEAKAHIGEQATVCGNVASARYAATTRGKPTFLNLDKPYPNQVFTVLIWGENREKFGAPEEMYRDKAICVTGKITEYRNAPEIVVSEPKNIEVQK